mmetsp:Transcript_20380/g.59083  ORF Transcript_20380/g.59083 Transcript_20380/m.59083 type:complete len:201 (+) Transcript_20380:2112-2714(+)
MLIVPKRLLIDDGRTPARAAQGGVTASGAGLLGGGARRIAPPLRGRIRGAILDVEASELEPHLHPHELLRATGAAVLPRGRSRQQRRHAVRLRLHGPASKCQIHLVRGQAWARRIGVLPPDGGLACRGPHARGDVRAIAQRRLQRLLEDLAWRLAEDLGMEPVAVPTTTHLGREPREGVEDGALAEVGLRHHVVVKRGNE